MRGLFNSRNDGKFRSLEGNVIPGMVLYEQWLSEWADKGIHLDGELVVPDMNFEKGCGHIRSFALKTNAHFMVFDLPSSAGVPLIERKRWLKRYLPSVYHLSGGKIRYIPHHDINSEKELDFWYKVYRGNGLEGVVVKQTQSRYFFKRSWEWMRLKPELTVDVKIVGFIEGTGKYKGTLGALVVQDPDGRRFRVGGGLTDSQRHAIWNNRAGYRGMPAEIVFQRRTNTGSYRHPRVKRFRLDRL